MSTAENYPHIPRYFSIFEKVRRKISSSSRSLHSTCPLFPGYWKWLPSKMTPFHDEVGQIKWVNCNILLPRMKYMYRVPQVEVDSWKEQAILFGKLIKTIKNIIRCSISVSKRKYNTRKFCFILHFWSNIAILVLFVIQLSKYSFQMKMSALLI